MLSDYCQTVLSLDHSQAIKSLSHLYNYYTFGLSLSKCSILMLLFECCLLVPNFISDLVKVPY